MTDQDRSHLPLLRKRLAEGRMDRREFLRTAVLLGASAGSAYAMAGLPAPARAQTALPQGGTIRIGMLVQEVTTPHAFTSPEQSNIARQTLEYLTRTGYDNITRPSLLDRWEPSPDLRRWDLHLRQGVRWHNGRAFTAADVAWNLHRVLDPAVGSSMLGLMGSYLTEQVETGATADDGTPVTEARLWSDTAIEVVDDHLLRLNLKVPQLAVPEHLFNFPMLIMDPEEGGNFGVGSNGTGPFRLTEHVVGERAVLEANRDYWGAGPHADRIVFVDLGDDAAASVSALVSGQVDGLMRIDDTSAPVLRAIPGLAIYETPTAQTGVARGRVDQPPFDDPRVRKALRLAVDSDRVRQLVLGDSGATGEHHHVAPIHPAYAELPPMVQDLDAARALLAEAGYSDGFETEITVRQNPAWELNTVLALAEQWAQVGIRARVNPMPSALYWDIWDKAPFSFTGWGHRAVELTVLALAYRSGGGFNESGYSNPEFDALLTEAEAIVDPDERRPVIARIQALLQEDGPIVQPLWRPVMTAFSDRVKGVQMHPTQYIFAEDLAIDA